MRILYVAGAGRSGTTLIANAVGSIDGATSWGELRYVWERGILQRRWCGCGQPLPECPTWRAIFAAADIEDPSTTAGSMVDALEPLLRTRESWRPLLAPRRRPIAALGPLTGLYRALADGAGRDDVIVDSSKLAAYAWVLAGMPDVDLRVVTVVRDPRAVAHSWGSVKELPDDVSGRGHMSQLTPGRAAGVWASQNLLTEAIAHRIGVPLLRVRYEDFTADPSRSLRRMAEFAGLDGSDLPLTDDGLKLRASHTVAGNPDRFGHTGATPVRRDDRWRTSMAAADRRRVATLTAPLLMAYGYRFRNRDEDS